MTRRTIWLIVPLAHGLLLAPLMRRRMKRSAGGFQLDIRAISEYIASLVGAELSND